MISVYLRETGRTPVEALSRFLFRAVAALQGRHERGFWRLLYDLRANKYACINITLMGPGSPDADHGGP